MEWYVAVILMLAVISISLLIGVVKLVFFIDELRLEIQKIQIELVGKEQ